MYAVIETGGKQYRVELGSELAVERLDAAPGETITFDRVLLVADGDAAQIGTPIVAEATVMGDVLRQDRGEKLIVFKYRPKARHRSKKGHRQEQTVIRVADIRVNGRSAADEAGEEAEGTAEDPPRRQRRGREEGRGRPGAGQPSWPRMRRRAKRPPSRRPRQRRPRRPSEPRRPRSRREDQGNERPRRRPPRPRPSPRRRPRQRPRPLPRQRPKTTAAKKTTTPRKPATKKDE